LVATFATNFAAKITNFIQMVISLFKSRQPAGLICDPRMPFFIRNNMNLEKMFSLLIANADFIFISF
jgi:hypothetical protein